MRERVRMVTCAKLKRRLPGLAKPPMPGELGKRIFDSVSQEAWDMWQEHSRLVINHYGLNLADPDSRVILRQEMERFLFGGDDDKPEGWTPDDSGGSPAKGKGAPAAPQKK